MLKILKKWNRKYFNDPEVILFLVFSISGFCILLFFRNLLSPILISLILVYLLERPTTYLEGHHFSRLLATSIVTIVFVGLLILLSFIVIPVIWQQGIYLIHDLPKILNKFANFINTLLHRYPVLMDSRIINIMEENMRTRIFFVGDLVVKYFFNSLIELIVLTIHLVTIPLIVFFLLKDKEKIFSTIGRILPYNQRLLKTIWKEMDQQISKYIRGKILEMVVVGIITWITFIIFNLNYSLFLSMIVGLSVLIPYIGTFLVTIPVMSVALFQFGFNTDFWICSLIYLIIQALDSSLLVPMLFSEMVNLHPLIIIFSIFIFGRLLGLWGIFLAIPLAMLVKTIIYVWSNKIMIKE